MEKKYLKNCRVGRISYAAIGWLIGLPLPVIIILLIIGGCDHW